MSHVTQVPQYTMGQEGWVFHTLLDFIMRTHSTLQWHKHQLVLVYKYVSAMQVGHTLNSLCSVALQPTAANVIILTSAAQCLGTL